MNRLMQNQPDYIFAMIRTPPDWTPGGVDDVPPGGEVLTVDHVASFEEAHDDLVRSNKLAMERKLNKWAVIQSPGGEI